MRLISICPSNTELAAYLGLTDDLIAVDDYSDWPELVNNLPRLGPDLSINMDLVEQLQPDLVLASLSVPGMEKNVEELIKRNIPHLVLNPQSFEDIGNDLMAVGIAAGKEKEAKAVVSRYYGILKDYKEKASNLDNRPTVYFEWWPNPIFTPGQVNWLTEMCELAGGRNSFHDVELASVQTSWDDIIRRNPDHICLAWVGVKQSRMKVQHVLKRESAENLTAVRENRIHLLEEQLYCRPSPRLLNGLAKLAVILHREHFPQPEETDYLTSNT
ncbi:cobalamin-binding protein [Metabacillus dongyingensis]|uniref:cobalamin-binding protein n=1 Tax=Metabacillus dongyingensis TaxID=2874282 RepID=UPI001CC1B62E|nr:cobalamin-binding protein [Metabacillus dongyingensis]UAL51699.1 cobalamin-binding protein [Metabacillus dongyingensis]